MSLGRKADFIVGVPLVAVLSPFARKGAELKAQPNKILIIKLAAMGDTILLATVLQSLRKAHPDAKIHWLASTVNAAVAKHVPGVDRVFVWERSLASLPLLLQQLRAEHYDLACDLEQWSRGSALITYFSGAPVRLGYDVSGQHRASLFTHTLPKKYNQHEILDFYDLLSLPKELDKNTKLQLAVREQGHEELKEKMPAAARKAKPSLRVLIHPGCGRDGTPREWPVESYAVLCHWLGKKYAAEIILTSGPEEAFKTKRLRKLLNGQAIDMGGRLSWDALIALVDSVDLIVSGNTGVMHIAAALGKRQIALHGPTDPKIWGPLNPNAKVIQSDCPNCPCLKLGFEYHTNDQSCMARIDVETVKTAVSGLIDNPQAI